MNELAIKQITDILNNKYEQWSWNYGYTLPYQYKHNWEYNQDPQSLQFECREGKIIKIEIHLTFLSPSLQRKLEIQLLKKEHQIDVFLGILKEHSLEDHFTNEIIQHSF